MARTSVPVALSIPTGLQDHLVETYTVVATGGTFDLGLALAIPYNEVEANIQTALDAVYTPGSYVVRGNAASFTVRHPFVAAGQTALVGNGNSLTGPAAAITQVQTYAQAGARLHVTDGAKFVNNGEVRLLIKSIGASHLVTIVTTKTLGAQALLEDDLPIRVQKDSELVIGPFPTDQFNQKSGGDIGQVWVNTDGTGTDVYIIPFKDVA